MPLASMCRHGYIKQKNPPPPGFARIVNDGWRQFRCGEEVEKHRINLGRGRVVAYDVQRRTKYFFRGKLMADVEHFMREHRLWQNRIVKSEVPDWYHNADGSDDFFYDAKENFDDSFPEEKFFDAEETLLTTQGWSDGEDMELGDSCWEDITTDNQNISSGDDVLTFQAQIVGNTIYTPNFDNSVELLWPFDEQSMRMIMDEYRPKSPFFSQKFDEWLDTYAMESLLEVFNDFLGKHYMMYTRGTLAYWVDQYFYSRRQRDSLLKHFGLYSLTAQADEVLEASSNVEQTANITFVNERPVDSDSTHFSGGEVSVHDPNKDQSDTPWTMNQVLTRKIVVYQGTWDIQGQYSIITHLPIPKCITDKKNSMVTQQLRMYAFARFGVEFEIQLNGTKFHNGQLICALLPLMWDDDGQYYDYVLNWVNFPHVMLDASVSNSGVLNVPFSHLLSHFPQEKGGLENDSICSLGRLGIAVFNKLRMGEGSASSLNFTVYAKLVNPEMHLPCMPINEFSYSNGLVTSGSELVTQGADEGFLKGIFSRGLSTALGGFLNTMTGGLAAGIGGVLKGLIFDKPIDPMPAPSVINRSVNAPCHGAGLDTGVRLALCPISQKETTEQQLGGTAGDFSMETLCSVPSLLCSRPWLGSYGVGATIMKIPVCPTYLPEERTEILGETVTTYFPTMIAYNARAHMLWTGPLCLKIKVVGTAFHNGRLVVIYNPSHSFKRPQTEILDNLMNYNCVVMDIEEQQELTIEIPYASVRPWLRCDAFRTDKNYPDLPGPSGTPLGESTNGLITIMVLNKLVAPANVSQDIDVNFFWYGGKGFELAVPCPLNPLSIRIPDVVNFGELEEYPWKMPPTTLFPVEIDNRDEIVALYFEGKALYKLKKIVKTKPGVENWWEYTPVIQWGNDTETLTWAYRASIFGKYQDVTPLPPQYVLMDSMPKYSAITAQGLEDYTSTRSDNTPQVCIMKNASMIEKAPSTLSENAMNFQTQIRRYYPGVIGVPLYGVSGFTLISIPVDPTRIPQVLKPVGKFGEGHPINRLVWLLRLYTFRSGSTRMLFVFSNSGYEIHVWFNPLETHKFSVKSGYKETDVQKNMCFAGNIAVTHLEASMQVEIPFHSPYNQLLTDAHGVHNDLRAQNGTVFVAIRNKNNQPIDQNFTFSVFFSTGEDFIANVIRPPPPVFEPQMLYSNCDRSELMRIASPEEARDLGNDSQKQVVPGTTGIKSLNDKGSIQLCKVPQLTTQGLFGLSETKERFDAVLDNANLTLASFNASDLIGQIQMTTNRVDNLISNFENQVTHLPERIESASKDTLTKYTILAAEVVACGAVLYSIKACLTDPSIPHFVGLAIAIAGVVGLAISATFHELIRGVIDWVMNLTFIPAQPQAQALDGALSDAVDTHSGIIATIVAVIGTVLYSYIFGIIPPINKIRTAIRSFFEEEPPKAQGLATDLGLDLRSAHFSVMGISALDKVYTKLVDYITRFINWMLDRENPEVIAARTSAQYQDRILKVVEELDLLEHESVFIEAMTSPMCHNRFYHLMGEVMELTTVSVKEKLDARVTSLIGECRKRAQKLIQRYERESPLPSARYDPYVVCFWGPTGTGKTHIMKHVAKIMQEEMNLPEYNLTYAKNIDDEFWSRYSNQPVILWDEFAQSREADKTIAQFMTLRGRAPVSLKMAQSEDKGRPFTSQGMVLTTNTPYVDFNTIRDNAAFKRRRQFMVEMRHNEGIDVNHMQNAAHDAYPNYEHCRFRRTRNDQRGELTPWMTWLEMKELLRIEIRAWHLNQMAALATEDSITLPRGVVAAVVPERPADFNNDDAELEENILAVAGELIALQYEALGEPDELAIPDEYVPVLAQAACDDIEVHNNTTRSWLVFKRVVGMELSEEEEFQAGLFLASVEQMTAATKLRLYNGGQVVKGKASRLLTLAKNLFAKMRNCIVDFYHNNPRLAKALGILTLLSGVALTAFALNSGEKLDPAKFEGAYESGPAHGPQPRVKMAESTYESGPTHKPAPRVRVAQGCEDPVAMDIKKKVHPQIYNIAWDSESSRKLKMKCLHIGGHSILAPYHFFSHAVEGERFELLHRYHPLKIEFVRKRMHRVGEYDWVVYDCGARLEPGKKLTKYFVREQDLSKLDKIPAFLLSVSWDNVMREAVGNATSQRKFEYKDTRFGDTYSQKGWRTNFATVDGDCGSVLLATTPRAEPPGKIIGLHVAGRSGFNEGYCVLITRELVEQAFAMVAHAQVGPVVSPKVAQGKNPLTDCRITPQGDYTLYGVMPNSQAPSQPIKTSFEKTPFYDEVVAEKPEPKKPAFLKPFVNQEGKRISPLKLALEKYGHQTSPFPQRDLEKVEFFLKHFFKSKLTSHTGKRVWDVAEAVNGIPGVEYADRLNMKSSPGWPYQVINKTEVGKAYLFNEDGTIKDALLQHCLNERIDAAQNLERVQSLWRDCLKDELRPVDKVDQGKTRLFNIAPVDFTIATRMYMMDFIMAFYAKNNDNFFSAVGMNPESYEWTKLYDHLREVSNDAIGGDFKCFDGTIPGELIMMVARIINFWYADTEENQNVRTTLFMEILHTLQLCENCVYCTHQGNPSGNPLTVILNTIVNLIYLLLAWLRIYPDKTIEDFFQWVRATAYGDDNLLTVHHSCDKFNQQNITAVLAEFGITYTMETKELETPKFRDLDSVTFLKRGFRRDPEFGSSFVLPTMSLETLESYFYYYRKSDDVEAQLRENMRAGLSFACFHGRTFYEAYLEKWMTLMEKHGLQPLCISFEEQVDNFLAISGAGGVKLDANQTARICDAKYASEGMESFMSITNNKITRSVMGLLEAPLYYLCAVFGLGSSSSSIQRSDDRWAVSIPSGEGKSTLSKKYPHVFVDHDELLLPLFSNQTVKEQLKSGLPWSPTIARTQDFPVEDRRILLVHHPDNTNRQMIGSVITHFPTFIRSNILQRLTQPTPFKMSRDERNAILLQIAQKLEPHLFEARD
nr:MAG: RNA-dependent RNA polymerase [Riboviria sp.]